MGRKSAQRMRTKQTRKLSAQSITTYMKTKHSVKYQSANVGGINVFYREAGDPANPAIVLLHGFPSSSHMFRGLIEELKDEFYLIAPDYPGFGFSDAPNIAQFEYTFSLGAKTTRFSPRQVLGRICRTSPRQNCTCSTPVISPWRTKAVKSPDLFKIQALRCFLWVTQFVRFSHVKRYATPVQGRIRHKRPPPHFVGPLHLFRFSLEQTSSALGRLLPFAFDSPAARSSLRSLNRKSYRYFIGEAKTGGFAF